MYRPCYKTCKKCYQGGDEYANHCLECESGYMFRPGDNPYNNCVVYSDYYYITPYNQYKVLDNLQCPEESKYIVKDGNKSYCIYDCKADEIYKYLYDGVCYKNCPANTFNENYVCKEIIDGCNLGKNQMDEKYNINQGTTEILVRTYLSEFNYTNNHVSLHTNKNYTIIIYENRECIKELSLDMPKVNFQECYDKVKTYYRLEEDLIIVIVDKKDKNNGQTFYSFFHPLSGYKLNAEEICKNETIVVTQNLTSILSENKESYELQSFLTDQGVNIFDLNDPFYTDLCYDFDNPSDKDIPLSDRIATVYPDVSLCDEGCQMNGINLENMTASCNCKFNDIANSNLIKDNAVLESVVGEVFDLIKSSNILVVTCYKYIFKHFTDSIGGMISIVAISGHLISTLIYFLVGSTKVKKYIYNIFEKFLSFVEKAGFNIESNPPKKSIKNKSLRDDLIKKKNEKKLLVHFNASEKEKKRSNSPPPADNLTKTEKRKILIDKPNMENYDIKNTEKEIIQFRNKSEKWVKMEKAEKSTKSTKGSKKEKDILTIKTNKSAKSRLKKNKYSSKSKADTESDLVSDDKYKDFFDEYLATSLDDLEYDDAIVKDDRTFCEYFIECLKERQMIAFTFIATDPIKIRIIKIMLFILNIVLYFVVIGLFYSEEYISQLYNLDKKDNFFSYIPRSIDKFIYTTMVSVVIGYIIDCFFIDEKKIKGIFKREKDNIVNLRSEIVDIIHAIKNRYFAFIIMIFIILLISFYYLLCFNYVYPKTQIEWVKASITIFIIMQILSVLKCFLETCLRFLSFKCKSEKLYKLSKLLD